jgi:hypothetical protein
MLESRLEQVEMERDLYKTQVEWMKEHHFESIENFLAGMPWRFPDD